MLWTTVPCKKNEVNLHPRVVLFIKRLSEHEFLVRYLQITVPIDFVSYWRRRARTTLRYLTLGLSYIFKLYRKTKSRWATKRTGDDSFYTGIRWLWCLFVIYKDSILIVGNLDNEYMIATLAFATVFQVNLCISCVKWYYPLEEGKM